ncbi:hypothetical protein, conserved [Trypanosoma cruzi]|uniref:Thioredoxin-like fold domain-containing protein n=1 Tax=Trypanosoma cruzi (strain CL Brener) TaxID=353153 RepID=Q4DDY0_TRYCC|nr:hypothetical protein, conserved [Trypanosoma cruzi]EAN90736.1 hypothetical protein, conserved [Trypanosoma cruzi]|eukprot:XP_812587.1 hypothetical protein [Trypanosoma cruzi strain CL Brener]
MRLQFKNIFFVCMCYRLLIFALFFSVCVTITAKSVSKDGSRDRRSPYKSDDEGVEVTAMQKFAGHIPWIEWRQLIRIVTAARCTLLSTLAAPSASGSTDLPGTGGDKKMHSLAAAHSESSNEICLRPIMLLFHQHECLACHALLKNVGISAEFELLSEYMTMVVAESLEDITEKYPYPLPHFHNDSLFVNRGRRKGKLRREEAEALREAFAGQGEYFPRVFFVFPQNGSVMPIFNEEGDSDPAHPHFYHEATSLVRSMMVALWTMNKAVSFSEL